MLRSLKPQAGESMPMAGGCLGTGCLHAVASVAVMGLGAVVLGREGNLIVLPFWLFLGLAQWLYLAPSALLLKRLGFTGIAKGVWLGAWLVVGLNVLYWVGFGVMTVLSGIETAEVRRFAREHPITHRDVSGTIAAADAKHIDVQAAEGIVSVELRSTTHYIRTGGPLGNMKASPDIVEVGAAVVVDAASYDGGPLYAEYVSRAVADAAGSPSPP